MSMYLCVVCEDEFGELNTLFQNRIEFFLFKKCTVSNSFHLLLFFVFFSLQILNELNDKGKQN